MYYASIGILSIFIHLIINYSIIFKLREGNEIPAHVTYRRFLFFVLLYYITDVLWEVLDALELKRLIFYETEIYYVVMGLSVLFWTQFVIDYLNHKSWFSNALKYTGQIFVIIQMIVLIVNLFFPIAFWFDDETNYHTENARNLNLFFQFLMFLATALFMTYEIIKTKGKIKHRYRAIEMFGFVMTIFVALQAFYPMMPFYAIGFMLGTCIIHTFVVEDERTAKQEELEKLLQIEEIQEAELGSARQMAFTDPLTGVKSKSAYQEDLLCIESRIKNNDLKEFGIIIFDVNDLKKVNDTKGHEAGDKIIKAGAKLICQSFKHSPVYRIGGDEFAVFLTGEDFKDSENILKNFNLQVEKNKTEGKVVVACGFTNFNPQTDKTYSQIFGRADNAMYDRKKELKEN